MSNRNLIWYPFILLVLGGSNLLFSQNQGNVWYFGDGCGIDFNTTPPTVLNDGALQAAEGSVSIADTNGDLLFYSEGVNIWDRNHNLMPNGQGLLGNTSSAQTALISHVIGQPNRYYVFTLDAREKFGSNHEGMNYSIVDMDLNLGLGDIDPVIKNIHLADSTSEHLTATMHANGLEYWVITQLFSSNEYHSYLVSCNGINPIPVISVTGIATGGIGYMKVSRDGQCIVNTSSNTLGGPIIIQMFDFDNETGKLSNPLILSSANRPYYGLEFSPNDSVIYVGQLSGGTQAGRILQYQRFAPNVSLTETIIYDGPEFITGMLLGPNGKIYISTGTSSYSVINDPNNILNPNLSINAMAFSSSTSFGVPNIFVDMILNEKMSYAGTDITICNNDSTVIGMNPLPGLTYLWSPGTGLSDSTLANPLASPSVNSTYVVSVSLNGGCFEVIDSVEVGVLNDFVDLGLDVLNCNNDTITLDAGNSGIVYSWSTGETTQTINTNSSGTYWVTVDDVDGCTFTDSIQINQSGINLNSITSDATCENADGIASIISSGGNGPYNYLWANGQTDSVATGLSSGSYSVLVTDVNGCQDSISVWIAEQGQPIITASLANNISCFGEEDGSIIGIAAGGTGPYNFSWSPGGVTTATASNLSPNLYTITITDANGCVNTDTLTITEPQQLTSSVTLNHATCDENNGNASVTAQGGSFDYTYSWSPFGGNLSFSSNLAPNAYLVTVTDQNNCQTTESFTITMASNSPTVTAWPDTTIQAGETVQINSSGGDSCLWTPEIGLSNPNDCSPTASPDQTSTYIVQVTENGCMSYDTIKIIVQEQAFAIYIPNAFTPTGDNRNDLFEISAQDVDIFNLQVFSRWGALVFESDDVAVSWNGTYMNHSTDIRDVLQIDTYVYKLNVSDSESGFHQFSSGKVSLLK